MNITDQEKDTLLTGVKSIREQNELLVKNYDQLSKETKTAFEDLTKVKENVGNLDDAVKAIQKVNLQLSLERRMAFSSMNPIQRIAQDKELRAKFNALVRNAVSDTNGDLAAVAKGIVAKALGEDSSPGSTMIDDRLAGEIYDTLAMYGVWNTFRVQPLGTKTTKFPVKTARPVANFVLTEGDTIADDSTKAGTSVSLEVEVIGVLLNVSLQLLQDSEFDVTADVLNDFAEAFAYRLDWAALQADGGADATDGGMTGIFAGGTAATATAGNITAESLQLEDFINVLTTVDAAVLNRPARWWIHPQMLARILAVRDTNGRSIFLTANEAPAQGAIGSILGYPVTPAFAAPSTNAASAKVAVFGDPAGMVVGVRSDFAFEASDHHKWNTFQRSFRGVGRAGVKIRAATAFGVLTLPAA